MQTDTVDAALDTLAESRARVRETRRLLSERRYRIAASRRRLNGAFGFAGASDDRHEALRASVRTRLASRALFPITSSRVVAGYGSGNDCVICREPIDATDVEYEVSVGARVAVVAHPTCWVVWRDESAAVVRETA